MTERPLSWVKSHYGWVSMGGVVAALLAQKGFVASASIFDGDSGFWVMGGSDRFRPELLVAGLGQRFSVLETAFKPYPCCRYIQSSIDAVLAIQRVAHLPPEEIEGIHVQSFHRLAEFMDPRPAGSIEGMFSLPYCLAVAAAGLPPGPSWVGQAAKADPVIRRLADIVTFELDNEADQIFFGERRYATSVTIAAAGQVWNEKRRITRGEPEDPLSSTDLRAKYHALVDPILGRSRALALEAAIDRLDELDDVRPLTEMAMAVAAESERVATPRAVTDVATAVRDLAEEHRGVVG